MVTSENKYVDCCYILPFVLRVFFNTQPRMKTKESDKMTIFEPSLSCFLTPKRILGSRNPLLLIPLYTLSSLALPSLSFRKRWLRTGLHEKKKNTSEPKLQVAFF